MFDKILIPPAVFEEVVETGKQNGQLDAFLIEEQITAGNIEVQEYDRAKIQFPHLKNNNLHPGELEAINLAVSLPESVILLDDEEARLFARTLGLQVKGTLGLLIDFKRRALIDDTKALNLLHQLNALMYLSGDLYNFVRNQLK